MNPPTPGHLFLIQRLIETAIKHNVHKAYIILSKSNSDNENPIDCPDKINVLGQSTDDVNSMIYGIKEAMISRGGDPNKIREFEVIPICVGLNEISPIHTIQRIITGYTGVKELHLFVVIGEDRQNMVDNLTDNFYNKNANIKSIDVVILPREDMTKYKGLGKQELEEMDMASVPSGAFSASFIRNIVSYDLRDKFNEIYRPFIKDDSKIETLYNLIKSGLEKSRPKSRTEKTRPMKYVYPMVKNNSVYGDQPDKKKRRKTSGGKKKRVSKNKSKTLKRRLKN